MGNYFLLCSFILLLSIPAFSEDLAVGFSAIADSSGNFYPLEVKYYKIVIVNVSENELKNVKVLIIAPREFSILLEGDERKERSYEFLFIPANSSIERIFELKALEATNGQVEIKAQYGVSELTSTASVYVTAIEAGLVVSGKLSDDSISKNSESEIVFDLHNRSNETLSNISAELFASDNILIISPPLEIESIAAGQSLLGNKLVFLVSDDVGGTNLLLRVFFDDSNGTHVVEKPFSVKVGFSGGVWVLVAIALVLLLAIIHFYKKSKGTSEEPKSGNAKSSSGLVHVEAAAKWPHKDSVH